jgi:hypothetical protein
MAQIILDSNNNLIQGDFDNATLNNRTKLQTTTTNATTNVYVVPNGSSTSAGVSVANNSSLTNASKIVMATNGSTDTQIISGVNGSGSYLPMSFYTNNALAAQISTAGVFSATGGIAASSMPVGSVLQVVNVTYSTYATTASSTFSDTGLTASITPSSAANKILVLVNGSGVGHNSLSSGLAAGLRLVRNSTSILQYEDIFGYQVGTIGFTASSSITYLDSPATTSATTYKLQFNSFNNQTTVFFNNQDTTSASTITLMEIKA